MRCIAMRVFPPALYLFTPGGTRAPGRGRRARRVSAGKLPALPGDM